MQGPFQEAREPDMLRSRLAEEIPLRPGSCACAFLFELANFIGVGVLFAVVVLGQRQGLSGGRVGVLVAAFEGCVLLGSFLAPLVSRILSVRAVLLLDLWTWLGCGLFLIGPASMCWSPAPCRRPGDPRPTRSSTARWR